MKSKVKVKGIVPKLRFPQFGDDGEWVQKKLGELTYQVGKKNKEGKKFPIYSINNKEGFLPQAVQFDGVDSNNRGYDITLYKLIEKNTFAYNPARINVGSIGYSGELHNVIISSLYVCFKTRSDLYDTFLSYFLKTHYFSEAVKKSVEGSIRNYLFYENFSTISICITNKVEQKKIVSCLTTIDELILAENKKLDTLKQHKIGLMQNLFPAEGETVPKVRFPEFRKAGEWLPKSIGDVAPLQRGFDLPTNEIKSGKIPVVYSNGIANYHNKAMAKAPGVITGRSGTIGKIHFVSEDYWPHNTTLWVTNFNSNNEKFIFYMYQTIGIERFSSGSGVPTLNRNDVHVHKVCIPERKREQEKIANCLSSIDNLITAQAQKIEALKLHKKGLMQQLFPTAIEENA